MFESKEYFDRVNRTAMADLRLEYSMNPDSYAFDCKRMAYGGFKTIVT